MHTYKLTTKCHFCAYLYALWLDMWDMGLAIHVVEDLNDSQDPKHKLFCRENAFVAIYALFSDNKCPLFTPLGGGGVAKRGQCPLIFTVFFISGLP